MNNFFQKLRTTDKLRVIMLPYVIIFIAVLGICSLINYFFTIRNDYMHINSFVYLFILPASLVLLGIYVWVRPRLKLLKMHTKKGDSWIDFYIYITTLLTCIPIILFLHYLQSNTGELLIVENPGNILTKHKGYYYQVKKIVTDKDFFGISFEGEQTGKYGNQYTMHIYIAGALYDVDKQFSYQKNRIWFTLHYKKVITNYTEQGKKEKLLREFESNCLQEFEQLNEQKFFYFKKINTFDRKPYLEALNHMGVENAQECILLEPSYESFTYRNTIPTFFILTTLGFLCLVFFMIMIPSFRHKKLRKIPSVKDSWNAFVKEVYDFLTPEKRTFSFYLLTVIMTSLFAAMVFSGIGFIWFDGNDLVTWGSAYSTLIYEGQWWRLFTALFLHAGVYHIFGNFVSLWLISAFISDYLRGWRPLVVFVICGVIGNICSILWYKQINTIGASSGIFGLYGVFLLFILRNIFGPDSKKTYLFIIGINIGLTFFIGLVSNMRIDNATHLGGFFSGIICGFFFYPTAKRISKAEQEEELL